MGFKPKTCVRYNEPWHAHALTFSCYHMQPFLGDKRVAGIFVEALDAARQKHRFDIWAYVIMPEHVHLLIVPRSESYSISTILAGIKRPVAHRAKCLELFRAPHFWQAGGGYDRNLWKVETIRKEIEYMHANPVRRSLCETPEQWPFSSAAYWSGADDVPLRMDNTLPLNDSLAAR